MFGLSRGQTYRRTDLSPEDVYREDLAVWQIEHDANSHDMTTGQRERFRLFVRAESMGTDAQHALYARWLARRGLIRG